MKMNNTTISVLKYFYKILFDESDFSAIAFVLENAAASGNLEDFVVSVDSIGRITGIYFFNVLPKKIEGELERGSELEGWF